MTMNIQKWYRLASGIRTKFGERDGNLSEPFALYR
jgi:hypothetical protein